MKYYFRRIYEDVINGKNLDQLIAIVLVLLVAIFSIFDLASEEVVRSTTLAILGFIALGFLVTRYRLDGIFHETEIENMVQLLEEKPIILKDMIANANEFNMMGLTLRNTTTENYNTLIKIAADGTKIRTLIVDLEKVDLDDVVNRFSKGANAENFLSDFKQALSQYEKLKNRASDPQNVNLKLLKFVPPFSLYIFPRPKLQGTILVEMYGYKSPSGSIPRFQITEYNHPFFYEYFMEQFELMWKDGGTVH